MIDPVSRNSSEDWNRTDQKEEAARWFERCFSEIRESPCQMWCGNTAQRLTPELLFLKNGCEASQPSQTKRSRLETRNKHANNVDSSRNKLANEGCIFGSKEIKNVVETLRRENVLDRPNGENDAQRARSMRQEALLQERAALAANRVKVQSGILLIPY